MGSNGELIKKPINGETGVWVFDRNDTLMSSGMTIKNISFSYDFILYGMKTEIYNRGLLSNVEWGGNLMTSVYVYSRSGLRQIFIRAQCMA
jgi:hypothetical protein